MAPADRAVGEHVQERRAVGVRGPGGLRAQVLPVRAGRGLRDVGNVCAAAIAVMSFRCWTLPKNTAPAGVVVVAAPNGVAPDRWMPVFM